MTRFTLTGTVLDTPDPKGLALFYQRLLGWPLGTDEPEWVTLRAEDGGAGLSFQLEEDHVPPVWPAKDEDPRMQLHLDIEVDDLVAAVDDAVAAGATVAAFQPQDDVRVCLDPAGHPSACGWTPEFGGRDVGGCLAFDDVADLPALPDGLTVRPLAADDVADAAALLEAAEEHDDTGEHWSPEDLTEWWVNDLFDLARDSLAVTAPDGGLVAWATVLALPTFRDAFRITLEARVHPAWRDRGIGRALLAWQLERGREVHAERHPDSPAVLAVEVCTSMSSLEGLVRRAGLTEERWYFGMERPLTDLPAVPVVDGVALVPFSWDRDDEIRRAHNAAFTEHHGSAERDETTWQTLFTGQRGFRPELSSLAVADGAVVAYSLAYVFEADTAANGYETVDLGQIGVLPSARGRGLAKATIASVLRAAAQRGFRSAALAVDSENVTGALALYEGLGFTRRRTQIQWALLLPPVGADRPQ